MTMDRREFLQGSASTLPAMAVTPATAVPLSQAAPVLINGASLDIAKVLRFFSNVNHFNALDHDLKSAVEHLSAEERYDPKASVRDKLAFLRDEVMGFQFHEELTMLKDISISDIFSNEAIFVREQEGLREARYDFDVYPYSDERREPVDAQKVVANVRRSVETLQGYIEQLKALGIKEDDTLGSVIDRMRERSFKQAQIIMDDVYRNNPMDARQLIQETFSGYHKNYWKPGEILDQCVKKFMPAEELPVFEAELKKAMTAKKHHGPRWNVEELDTNEGRSKFLLSPNHQSVSAANIKGQMKKELQLGVDDMKDAVIVDVREGHQAAEVLRHTANCDSVFSVSHEGKLHVANKAVELV